MPTHKTAHLQIAQADTRPKLAKELFSCQRTQAQAKDKLCKRATKPTYQKQTRNDKNKHERKEGRSANSGLRNGGCSASYDSFMVGSSAVR